MDLKLQSKKLKSGKHQVKFYATITDDEKMHGYTLVEAGTTLKKVVEEITSRLLKIQRSDSYQHLHLYNLGEKQEYQSSFMVFKD